MTATESNKKLIEQEKQAWVKREAKAENESQQLAKLVEDQTIAISQKAGENDQLFGSVTAKDLAEALELKGFSVDRRKIQLEEPIKTLGEFQVPVKLHKSVTATLKVIVTREE